MAKRLGIIGALLVILFSINSRASYENSKDHPWVDKPTKYSLGNLYADVDFERERIVLTANILNKNSNEDLIFGGTFSPSVSAYLKPLNKSSLKAFAHIRCLTLDCTQITVTIGIRSSASNPYAYSERRMAIF